MTKPNNLGEKLTQLRNAHHLSQEELATKIGVSRQSVSKWETNASIPDLDKLILLSEIYQISLDALVKENIPCQEPLPVEIPTESLGMSSPSSGFTTQKIIGFILLALGLFSLLLALVFQPALAIFGAYFLLCSILCLTIKKYAGLIIGWLTFLPLAYRLPYFTGTSMGAVFNPYLYQDSFTIHLVVAYCMWATFFLLSIITVKQVPYKKQALLVCGWLSFWWLKGFLLLLFRPHIPLYYRGLSLLILLFFLFLLFHTGKQVLFWRKTAEAREKE